MRLVVWAIWETSEDQIIREENCLAIVNLAPPFPDIVYPLVGYVFLVVGSIREQNR